MDEKRSLRSMLHTNIGYDKRVNLSSPPPPYSVFPLQERQRTNAYEDLFTVTAKSRGDVGSVIYTSDSIPTPTPVGRPTRGWSKRTKLLIAFAVFVTIVVAVCVYLAIATTAGDSNSGKSEGNCTTITSPRHAYAT